MPQTYIGNRLAKEIRDEVARGRLNIDDLACIAATAMVGVSAKKGCLDAGCDHPVLVTSDAYEFGEGPILMYSESGDVDQMVEMLRHPGTADGHDDEQ